MPIQPVPEIKPAPEQVEVKPAKPKLSIGQRFQAVKAKVSQTAAKLGDTLGKVIFDAASRVDLTDEQSRVTALADQLNTLNTVIESQIGITPEVAQLVPKDRPRTLEELQYEINQRGYDGKLSVVDVPKPKTSNAMDNELAQKWIDAHPEGTTRDMARAIINETNMSAKKNLN